MPCRARTTRTPASSSLVSVRRYAFTDDATVSGMIAVGAASAGYPGVVRASLTVLPSTANAAPLRLSVAFDQREKRAKATLSGLTGTGRRLLATMPAP